MVKVLVVDDQVLIRAGLAALIRAAPGFEVVGEAASGEEAVLLAASARPDVVLMDVRMPGIGGIRATESIMSAPGPYRPKVLVLTTFDIDEHVYDALRAGASGFLLKDTSPRRLLAGIEIVAGGDTLLSPAATRHLVEAFVPGRGDGTLAPAESLTARENEVLVLVARGLSNAEIAGRLGVGESTVKTHLNRLMAKLGLASRAQVVAFAYESGLIRPRRPGTAEVDGESPPPG